MSSPSVISDIVSKLRYFTQSYRINSLFIIGGYCRERVVGNIENLNSIEVVSAHSNQAIRLCALFASEILSVVPTFYYKKRTGVVEYSGVQIEFQEKSLFSHMKEEDVRIWMKRKNIENNNLLNNLYGRDFTINALIMSLVNGEFYDLTRRSLDDIKSKKISSILPSELLLKYNPISILRAIRFSCQYDFSIDPALRKQMKKHYPLILKSYSKEKIVAEIEKILKANAKDGIKKLRQYGLISSVAPQQLKKYLEKNDEKD